jgi:DNA-binding MarR family transcriptional regulator
VNGASFDRYHLTALANLVGRLAADRIAARLEPLDLTYAQAVALARLWRSPDGSMRQSDLIESLAVSRASGSAVLQDLTERGLVVRTIDRHDGRMQVVTLTEAGRELEPAVAEVFDAVEVELISSDPAEVETAFAVLRGILDRARELRHNRREEPRS